MAEAGRLLKEMGCSEHSVFLQRLDKDSVFNVIENLPDVIGVCGTGEVRVDDFALLCLRTHSSLFIHIVDERHGILRIPPFA